MADLTWEEKDRCEVETLAPRWARPVAAMARMGLVLRYQVSFDIQRPEEGDDNDREWMSEAVSA
jgi:hypothetical protein